MFYELMGIAIGLVSLFLTLIKLIGDMQKDLRSRLDIIYTNIDDKLDSLRERIAIVETKLLNK
jgi:hypothetical protein